MKTQNNLRDLDRVGKGYRFLAGTILTIVDVLTLASILALYGVVTLGGLIGAVWITNFLVSIPYGNIWSIVSSLSCWAFLWGIIVNNSEALEITVPIFIIIAILFWPIKDDKYNFPCVYGYYTSQLCYKYKGTWCRAHFPKG